MDSNPFNPPQEPVSEALPGDQNDSPVVEEAPEEVAEEQPAEEQAEERVEETQASVDEGEALVSSLVEETAPVEEVSNALGAPGTVVSGDPDSSNLEAVIADAVKSKCGFSIVCRSESDMSLALRIIDGYGDLKVPNTVRLNPRLQVRALWRRM